jgi:hypothetical protein
MPGEDTSTKREDPLKIIYDLSEPNSEVEIPISDYQIDDMLEETNVLTTFVWLRVNGYYHERARGLLSSRGVSESCLKANGIPKLSPESEGIDKGRVGALIDAGWSYQKIRGEFFGFPEDALKKAIREVLRRRGYGSRRKDIKKTQRGH